MTTEQNNTTALTDQELDQVNGGMYLPGRDGPVRPLAFPLIPLIVLVAVGAGIVWGAGKVNDGTDKVQEAAGGK